MTIEYSKPTDNKVSEQKNKVIANYDAEMLDVWLNLGNHDPDITESPSSYQSWKSNNGRGLKVFITNKQEGQFKKGDISKWVNIAITNLTAGYSTHTHSTQNSNPYNIPKGRLKAKNLMLDICNQLIQSGLRHEVNPQSTIPFKHLDQMIRDVTGRHDKRTVESRMKDLVRYGYITDKGYTNAFLILDTGTNEEYFERLMERQKQDERIKNNNDKQAQKEFDTIMENLK